MAKTINFKEILLSKVPEDCYWKDMDNLTNCPVEHIIEAMKEAVRQTLELASENAEIKACDEYHGEKFGYLSIDKKSITDTIKQIEP